MTDPSKNGVGTGFFQPAKPTLWVSAGLVALFSSLTLIFPTIASSVLASARVWTLSQFDWLFAVTPVLALTACIFFAVSPVGGIRLGGADAQPEFSRASWIAMLFAAGVGIGFMFYGTTEPLAYYSDWAGAPLATQAGSPEARRLAFSATLFHWGLAPWAIYATVGLALGYSTYNCNLPLSIRSAFFPIFGDGVFSWRGALVDLFATVSTIFGLATTIGIGATQASAGLSHLIGAEGATATPYAVIALITGAAIISVLRGVNDGVRWLSNFNLALALILLAFVVAVGPTIDIIAGVARNSVAYVMDTPALTAWLGRPDVNWFHDWTIFYWAWWISWSPFVGLFIARISKGRTIREFVVIILFAPTMIAAIWFTAFGETAIQQFEAGSGALAGGISDASLTLFQMLAVLPGAAVTSAIAMALLIVFIVTSADSGALVLERLNATGRDEPSLKLRVFWTLMLGSTAAALLLGGGVSALQTLQAAVIVAALPFTIIIILITLALVMALSQQKR
ncbi:MAG: BCCT family transporter [Pseudomonadota bacterium]